MEQIILGDEPLMANCYKTLMPTPLSDDGVRYTLLQAHNSGVQFNHTQNLSSAVQFPRLQNSGSQLNHVQSRNSGAQTVQFDKPPPLLFGPLQTPLPNAGVQFTGPPPDQNLEVLSDPTRNPRYKTEICRNFKERARCIYGDQCQFAHGRRELRDVVRNNKYKTKLCQKYWLSGYCAYGPRCNFLHDEDKQMSEVAVKEYGLDKKKPDLSWMSELGVKTTAKSSNSCSSNRSPVNLFDVENLESLDCLRTFSCVPKLKVQNCCFEPFRVPFDLESIVSIAKNNKDQYSGEK